MCETMEIFEKEIRNDERIKWIRLLEEKFGLTHKQAKDYAKEVAKSVPKKTK